MLYINHSENLHLKWVACQSQFVVAILPLRSVQICGNCQLSLCGCLASGPSICVFLTGFLVLSKRKLIRAMTIFCCL